MIGEMRSIHNNRFTTGLLAAWTLTALCQHGSSQQMDKMWGDTTSKTQQSDLTRGLSLRDGRYGMFIHWGLYSSLAGKWKDKTYYGIGEWIMHPAMAGIPVDEYMETARAFNPDQFDAQAIVQMAKDAGMRYVIITSKHHEGFAMFKSVHPFNIVDASPFQRDPMKELSYACRAAGLGFGFYYSHFQDWTSPGAHGGPSKNADGTDASFEKYFREKCYPQVKEICTNYGPLDVIWFDTPGSMPKELVVELHDLVRATQPKALLGSRIGHGMGDYESLGDMEVPPERVDGFWESCDTTNDSWSYAWYDSNWKSPKVILHRLVSTVARGGNYLLNIGPDGKGSVPAECQEFLKQAGAWLKAHPEVIYESGPSPWRYAMPWGDVTVRKDGKLNLVVFDLPQDGFIHLPGLATPAKSAFLINDGGKTAVDFEPVGESLRIRLPESCRSGIASLIEFELAGKPEADPMVAVHPNTENDLLVHFAEAVGAEKKKVSWMEKFGEWKHATQISKWQPQGVARWTANILQPGFYQVTAKYRGEANPKSRVTWRISTDEKESIQNQQPVTSQYLSMPMGVFEIKTPGKRVIEVSLVDGDPDATSLESIGMTLIR
jgi:alpha-L-fucosidase